MKHYGVIICNAGLNYDRQKEDKIPAHKGGIMTVQEMKDIARQRGLNVGSKKKKLDIVRAIQKEEGNNDCFMSEWSSACGQSECLWREDCSA